jgi:hypothetical protein
MTASKPGNVGAFNAPDYSAERTSLRARLRWLEREMAVCRADLQMVEAALLVQNNRERLHMDPDGFLAAHPRGAFSVRVKTPIKSGSQKDQILNLLAQDPDREFTADEVRAALNIPGLKNVRNLMSGMARDELLVKVAPATYRFRQPDSPGSAEGDDRGYSPLALPAGSDLPDDDVDAEPEDLSPPLATPNYWRPAKAAELSGLTQMRVPLSYVPSSSAEVSPVQPNGYQ